MFAILHLLGRLRPRRTNRSSRSVRADVPCARRGRLLGAGLLLLAAGCRSSQAFHDDADEDVYRIVAERLAEIADGPAPFRIDPPPDSLRERILGGEFERGGLAPLGLAECLQIAAENSRDYRRRQELLYLAALDLTFERYVFSTQLGAGADASADGDLGGTDTQGLDIGGAFTRLLGTGARILGDVTFSFVRDLAAGGGWGATSAATLSITQPLLRGRSREVVRENLTQAERDVLYEVRVFERFRRTFGFDVADRLYRILQQMDTVDNVQNNYDNLILLRERNQVLGEAGRISGIDVDRARQDELRAQDSVISATQRLERSLDDFKLFLGLPITTPLTIRRDELDVLIETGIVEVDYPELELTGQALQNRLDYLNVVDQLEDAERRVRVAADALGADLELTAGVTANSAAGKPFKLGGTQETGWTAGLGIDLPIDRLQERNAFRRSEINVEALRREEQEFSDGVRADLRDAMRNLRAARDSYRIQFNSVQLAERRIESTRLQLEAGRAETRDLLDSQEDLLAAQNAATGALIDYVLASLALVRDAGFLRLDETGLVVDPAMKELLER